jgi:hypothetical protein
MGRLQGLPFGGIHTEGIKCAAPPIVAGVQIAVNGDRQRVWQEEFVESIVEVTWPLNEDGSRLPIVNQLPQQSGRCGAMVPHGEEDDFSIKAIEGSMIDLTGSQRVIHIYYNNGKMANQFPDI